MTDIERLAVVLKGFKNQHKVGIVIGRVVEAPPDFDKVKMAVDVYDQTIPLTDFYSLCGSSFEIGDKVAIQYSDDNQIAYVLGRPIFIGGDER